MDCFTRRVGVLGVEGGLIKYASESHQIVDIKNKGIAINSHAGRTHFSYTTFLKAHAIPKQVSQMKRIMVWYRIHLNLTSFQFTTVLDLNEFHSRFSLCFQHQSFEVEGAFSLWRCHIFFGRVTLSWTSS
jgi:hypothetical protein